MQVGLRNLLAARRNFPSSLEAEADAAEEEKESKLFSGYYYSRRREKERVLIDLG